LKRSLAIRKVGRKGLGVVTTEPIRSGTMVIGYYGRPKWIWNIPKDQWNFCVQVDYDKYVLPRRGSFGRYVNHSCDPNCVIKGAGRIVAWRDIRRGEEITFDYSTNVGWEPYEMKCLCGAKSCRGVVRSYFHLSPTIRQKYGRNLSAYLLGRRPPA